MGKSTRIFVGLLVAGTMLVGLLAACARPAPTPTTAPSPTVAPSPPPAPKPSPAPLPAPSPVPPPKPKVDVIKIGEISGYTGPIASIAQRVKEGQDLAVEEINAAGGIKSLGGAKLEMSHFDHEWKSEVMKEYVDRFINRDKVHVFLQGSPSGFGVMAGKMCQDAVVPHYTILVNTPAKTQQGFKTIFSTPKDSRMIASTTFEMMNFLADTYFKQKPKKVALLHPDNEYPNQVAEGATKVASKFGYEVVADVVYPFPAKDFTSFILKLKAANPDWLFINPIGEAVAIERTLDVLAWDPLRIGIEGSYIETALMELGARAENIISSGPYADEATPDAKAFVDKYQKRWGHAPDSMSAQGYQITYVIAAAVEKAGREGKWDTLADARKSIIDASRALVYTRETGPMVQPYKRIQYDETGQVPAELCPTAGTQVQGGKFRCIYPKIPEVTLKFRDGWKQWQK